MAEPLTFTFRHVSHILGLPSDNRTNWAVGHQIARLAAKHGVEPDRKLTVKTNPNPSVAAPHCIGHYPIRLFPVICEGVREWWGDQTRQLDLFEGT